MKPFGATRRQYAKNAREGAREMIRCPYCETDFKHDGNWEELQKCPNCRSELLVGKEER